jgi:predicted dehydrogenase
MSTVRIGVLGAGHLGRIHVQQLLTIPQWDLVGVHDPDPARCVLLKEEFGVRIIEDPAQLVDAVDVVDIVTPTVTHHALAMDALSKGRHVFIEKPLAHTMDEARELVATADKAGLQVQVGHVERFNPAFRAALPHLDTPMFIETHRLAQFDPRGTDVSVVLDLMIHDIDIVLHVVRSPLERIDASGVAVVSDTPDIANARFTFANGCVANLTASRISLKKMRKSRFFQRDAYISVDMLTKEAEIIRMKDVEGTPDPFAVTMDLGPGKGTREIMFDKPEVPAINAIREELAAFAQSVLNGTRPVVPITDGAAALEAAHRVLESMGRAQRPSIA